MHPAVHNSGLTESEFLTFVAEPNPNPDSREVAILLDGVEAGIIRQEGTSSRRPQIANNGTVEGAAFFPEIVSGGWASILGTFFIDGFRVWGGDDFTTVAASGGLRGRLRKRKKSLSAPAQGVTLLPTSLDGVSVTVGGRPAFVQFLSNNQLNVLIDDDDNFGFVDIVVTTPDGVSFTETAIKRSFVPQFFRFEPNRRIYVAGVHLDGVFLGAADLFDGAVATRPARPGSTVQLFGTGWGPTIPPTPTAQLVTTPAPLANEVVIRIGGVDARVQFAGIVGSGLYQLNVVIPDLPAGDHEVEASVAGFSLGVQAFITIGG